MAGRAYVVRELGADRLGEFLTQYEVRGSRIGRSREYRYQRLVGIPGVLQLIYPGRVNERVGLVAALTLVLRHDRRFLPVGLVVGIVRSGMDGHVGVDRLIVEEACGAGRLVVADQTQPAVAAEGEVDHLFPRAAVVVRALVAGDAVAELATAAERVRQVAGLGLFKGPRWPVLRPWNLDTVDRDRDHLRVGAGGARDRTQVLGAHLGVIERRPRLRGGDRRIQVRCRPLGDRRDRIQSRDQDTDSQRNPSEGCRQRGTASNSHGRSPIRL